MASNNAGWRLDGPRLWIGESLRVSFQRTALVVDAEAIAPPKSYGAAPLWPAVGTDVDLLVAIGDGEAFWLGFSTTDDRPVAVRVLIDAPRRVDALTGAPPEGKLVGDPQNYLVCPPQSALDGLRVDASHVAPFVRGGAEAGAGACERLSIVALPATRPYTPKPKPATGPKPMAGVHAAQGANVRQTVLTDPYGAGEWQEHAGIAVRFRLVTHAEYACLSGQPSPPPLDQVSTYNGRRYP